MNKELFNETPIDRESDVVSCANAMMQNVEDFNLKSSDIIKACRILLATKVPNETSIQVSVF